RMFDRQERSDQIDLQDALPMIHALLEQRNKTAADPGVGINDVERSITLQRLTDESLDVVFLAGVGGHELRAAAVLRNGLRGLRQPFRILIDDEQTRAFAREQNRAGAADAVCRAGDDCHLAIESSHERPLLFYPNQRFWPGCHSTSRAPLSLA